jgi:hypothetical protein
MEKFPISWTNPSGKLKIFAIYHDGVFVGQKWTEKGGRGRAT